MEKHLPIVGIAIAGVSVAVLLLALGVAVTQQRQPAQTNAQINAAVEHMQSPEARIIELPEDGKAYRVTVLVHSNWRVRPMDRRLIAWWATSPQLTSVRAQCVYNAYTTGQSEYKTKFAKSVPESDLPAVLIQEVDGQVHWSCNRHSMPQSDLVMANCIRRLFKNRPYYIFSWRHPDLRPQPEPPAPPDNIDVDVDVEPAPIFQQPPPESEPANIGGPLFIGLAILVAILSVLAGILVSVKSRIGG